MRRPLQGYQAHNKDDVINQVRAIFDTVRSIGVSYVNSTVNFGQIGIGQRVRLPRTSLQQKAANCIDGAVLFASLFENIGLEPVIVLIPNHAFVGVRLAPGGKDILFIETTLVGRHPSQSIITLEHTFDAAVWEGSMKFNMASRSSQNNPNVLHIIDIKSARSAGIYPLL